MKDFLRPLGPTAVVLALVLVVGGATATIAQNLITGADIKDGSIKAADLATGAVKTAEIADGQVKSVDVKSNSITGTDINEGSLGQVPNVGKVDGLDANDLTRVAWMSTSDSTLLPADITEVTYGSALSITAPTDGFVMIHGSTTVIGFNCTTGCYFTARIRHDETDVYSMSAQGSLYSEVLANTSHASVFAVSAGVNNFTIRIIREPGDGELYGWWGELAAVFSPFGPTGETSSETATTEMPQAPGVDELKPLPGG